MSVDTKDYVATLTMSSVGNAFKLIINAIDALMTWQADFFEDNYTSYIIV